MTRRPLRTVLVAVALAMGACGGPADGGDRDRDGVSDGWDAHPDQAAEVDAQIETAVHRHAGKPGLVSVRAVGARVDSCGQSPSEAVAVIAAHPQQNTC